MNSLRSGASLTPQLALMMILPSDTRATSTAKIHLQWEIRKPKHFHFVWLFHFHCTLPGFSALVYEKRTDLHIFSSYQKIQKGNQSYDFCDPAFNLFL